MKRIVLPPKQRLVGVRDGQAVVHSLGLTEYLNESIFPVDYWRTGSAERLHTAVRLMQAFAGREPGDDVVISDRDHEMLVDAAMLKAKDLAPPVVLPVLTLLCALTDAADVTEEKQAAE